MTPDARYAVRNNHGCQAEAIEESPIAYACHAFGDGHRSQAGATFESMIPDIRHIIRDNQIFHLFPIQE